MSKRNPSVLGEWGPEGKRVVAAEPYWRLPLKWDRDAQAAGVRRRVFCASLADFAEEREELIEPRRRLFRLIGETRNLDWLLLTKRPLVVQAHWPLWAGYWAAAHHAKYKLSGEIAVRKMFHSLIIPNVWLGVSVEDQKRADERIPLLLQTPAAVRFLSVEPLLGPVEFSNVSGRSDAVKQLGNQALDGIHWVIVGGESGHGARPCNLEWVRSVVRQCRVVRVACFVKQVGSRPYVDHSPPGAAQIAAKYGVGPLVAEFIQPTDKKGGDPSEWPADLRVREWPGAGV